MLGIAHVIGVFNSIEQGKVLLHRNRRSSRLLLNLGGTLLLLLVMISLIGSRDDQSMTEAFLARQAAAVRPSFQSDLESLADAPRYSLQAAVDPDTGDVAGQMTLDYTNTTQDTLSELVFRLFPNADTIYGGGSLSVSKVVHGEITLNTTLSDDRTVLHVPLEQPLKPGQAISVDLTFYTQVPEQTTQGYGILNRALGVVSLAGWYPLLAVYEDGWQAPPVPATGDAMWAETSLYEVILTVPAGYQVVSTGIAIGRQDVGDQVTWHLVSGPAREFAMAISNRFLVTETQVDEVTIHYYTLPAQTAITSPQDGLKMAAGAFHTYVNTFGPYPFTELDLVEISVPIDGYEFSGMVAIDYSVRTQEKRDDYQYVLAHEVAHQWWYGLVGNSSVYEPWLDEALVTYSATIYVEEAEGPAAADGMLAAWRKAEGSHTLQDPPLNSSTLGFSSWSPYHRIAYTHGALFLDELRGELGDKSFFELLERYQTAYRYRIAQTPDFVNLAQEITGQDLAPLFDYWFDLARQGRRDTDWFRKNLPESLELFPQGPTGGKIVSL